MKGKLRKILAFFMAAVVAACALCVSVSAKGVFDDAKKMDPLEYYSHEFRENTETIFYKITIKTSGKLTFHVQSMKYSGNFFLELLNSNAEQIYRKQMWENSDYTTERLQKGTYYLKICADKDKNFKNLYYSFTPDDSPTISLSVTIKKGSTLELDSVTENYSGKVSWVSTKPEIATVSSKGVVTAKKKGTTTIRAQLDSGEYVQIKVKVK